MMVAAEVTTQSGNSRQGQGRRSAYQVPRLQRLPAEIFQQQEGDCAIAKVVGEVGDGASSFLKVVVYPPHNYECIWVCVK